MCIRDRSEVIYGAGKTAGQIAGIVGAMREGGQERVLITRLDEAKARGLADLGCPFEHVEAARCGVVGELPEPDGNGEVLVLTAEMCIRDRASAERRSLSSRTVSLTSKMQSAPNMDVHDTATCP